MPAKSEFAKIIAACFSLLVLPVLVNGQCPPNIDIFENVFILLYQEPNVPIDLDKVDLNFEGGPIGLNYEVIPVLTSWQTEENVVGINETGTLTIHYNDLSTDVCDYINGIYNDPLPIELGAFNAHLMGNDVFLSWSTESEIDNAGFEIERSFDGENFERVAFRNGAGESEEKLWYSYEDNGVKNIALGKAVYYRLKQINYDQTFWYSWVVAVDLKINIHGFKITKILGWNSPDRMIKVYFHNPANIKKVNVLIATINGQLIEQKSIYPIEGFNFFEIDLSEQKENLFFISLNNGKETTVEKLILHSPN